MVPQGQGPRGIEREKQVAAEAAAELVENGMTVGLGTGSTVAFLLPALARRSLGDSGGRWPYLKRKEESRWAPSAT